MNLHTLIVTELVHQMSRSRYHCFERRRQLTSPQKLVGGPLLQHAQALGRLTGQLCTHKKIYVAPAIDNMLAAFWHPRSGSAIEHTRVQQLRFPLKQGSMDAGAVSTIADAAFILR